LAFSSTVGLLGVARDLERAVEASEADQSACGGSVPVAKRSGHAVNEGLEGSE